MDLLQNIRIGWTEKIDPLVTSNYQVPLIIFAYLYFVLDAGPRFMKNKQPYSLKTFMKIYNIAQIMANAWLLYDIYDAGIFTTKFLFCPNKSDYSNNSIRFKVYANVCYCFAVKILDYIDTTIFVLRKKDNQVSSLHLYHHVSTLLCTWFAAKYYPIIPVVFNIACNSFIHVIMYTYYYLATLGPDVQKQVAPMKRWITIAQMVQFCLLILFALQIFLPGCRMVPRRVAVLYIGNLLMNFHMFYNFYQKTYRNPKKSL